MAYSGVATEWDQVVLRDDPRSRVRGLWLRDSVSSSSMNVDIRDVNQQLEALIRSRRAVDAATPADPDTPLEPLVAEEEPTNAS
jgi:3-phenylpropionate/trans-cinnamate dioxygenase ferredoxin reductase component